VAAATLQMLACASVREYHPTLCYSIGSQASFMGV